ncbi:MAG: hypothetical protein J0L81_15810 [Caulobacterales bacterium]|nr:hypothetical protein [Caulobacterales bacterium]
MKIGLCALVFAGAMALAGSAFAEPDLTSEMYGRSDFLGGDIYTIGDEILISFKVMNRATATSDAPGTLSADTAGWMADVVLSTDARVPRGFATYSPAWREDVLLRGGRMSRTNDLRPGAEQMFNGPNVMRGGPPPRPYDYLAFPMPTGLRAGAYHVCVVSDPANVVPELNERDNTTCMAITIRARLSRFPLPRPPLPRGGNK